MAMSPCALAANLSISASFCAGSVAALISVNAWSASEFVGIGTNFPISCAQTESAAQAIPATKRSAPTSTFSRRMDASRNGPVATPSKMECAQILAPRTVRRKQIRFARACSGHLQAPPRHGTVSTRRNRHFPKIVIPSNARNLLFPFFFRRRGLQAPALQPTAKPALAAEESLGRRQGVLSVGVEERRQNHFVISERGDQAFSNVTVFPPRLRLARTAYLLPYHPTQSFLQRLSGMPDVLPQYLVDSGLVAPPACALHLIAEPRQDFVVQAYSYSPLAFGH